MAKLTKNMYKSLKTGERRLNCYGVNIPKEVVKKAGLDGDTQIKVYAEKNKIIIEKA